MLLQVSGTVAVTLSLHLKLSDERNLVSMAALKISGKTALTLCPIKVVGRGKVGFCAYMKSYRGRERLSETFPIQGRTERDFNINAHRSPRKVPAILVRF